MTIRSLIARRFEGDEGLLLGGLVLALLVLFVEPLQRVFVIVRDIERWTGTAMMPALVVLLATLMLHHQRKRHHALLEAQAAAAALHATDERARDLERLVAFGHATADALDAYALREATQSHLVEISGGRDAWVLLRASPGGWHELAQASATGRTHAAETLQAVAESAVARGGERSLDRVDHSTGTGHGHVCFPMWVGGDAVGVLGVWADGDELSAGAHHRLTAAAALLAIAVKNVDLVHDIREHSRRDVLTGCGNRAHALEALEIELRRAERSGCATAVVMLDLDHFKRINDSHGHLAGDAVLSHVGDVLRRSLRASDVKARYGGEEFLVVLPETSLFSARLVAESLRQTLAQTPVTVGDVALRVTASLGLTVAAAGELDVVALIARADSALYAAKRLGRNCVQVIGPPPGASAPGRGDEPAFARPHARGSVAKAGMPPEAGIQ